MTTFVDLVAGTTTTTGTGSYAISGSVDGFRPFSVVADSTELTVYVSLGSDYELVTGVVSGTGTTLTRASVIHSSNSGAAVNWGAGTKTLRVVADSSMLQQWGRAFAEKPSGEPILLVSTGQSDTAHWNKYTSGQPAFNARVFDWSTDGTGSFDYATSTRAWRNVDPTDEYVDYAVRYVGHPRKSNIESPSVYATNYALETAKLLQTLTGRDVYTVNVYATGTEIDNATAGWLYDPGGGNTADWLADEIAAAIAAAPAGVTLPSVPDVVIWSQGTSDADSTASYADMLAKAIDDFQDSNRWGWAQKGVTQWYIVENAPILMEAKPSWNGWGAAQEMAPDEVRYISSSGAVDHDGLHMSGQSSELIGLRIATAILGGSTTKSGMGAFRTVRNWQAVEDVGIYYTFEGTGGSAPASGKFNHSVAEDVLRIHKTDGNPFGATDQSASGVAWLHRDGCVLTFEEVGTPANYRQYTVTSLPDDNTTYWEWAVSAYVEGGTPPTGSDLCILTCNRKIAADGDVLAVTGLPISSGTFAKSQLLDTFNADSVTDQTTRKYSQIVTDLTGKAAAMGGEFFATNTAQSTSATAIVVSSGNTSSGEYCYAHVTVIARRTASTDMFVAIATLTGYNAAGTFSLIDSNVETVFGVTGLSISVASLGVFGGWRVNFTGKASETWDVKSVTRTTLFEV